MAIQDASMVGFAYKDIAHDIDDLLSRIVRTVERYKLYHEHEQILNDPMIRVVHRLLLGIVAIIRLCIESMNRSKTARFKRLVGVAFFSIGGGIKDQFAVLDSLDNGEAQMAAASTLLVTERSQRLLTAGFDKQHRSEGNRGAPEKLDKVWGFARAPKEAATDDDDGYGAGLSSVQGQSLIGRYYRRVGEVENARELLRKDVDIDLEFLPDDDINNDYQGYRKLGDAFMDFSIEKYRSLLNPDETLNGTNTVQDLKDTGSASEENAEAAL
ncbi:hypothetical protein G6011_03879 [Alternaria panax]|uniref:Uncharacterized protein n=1 Tax=Alternaria panax TaxID=48097 RepID=A0AAD4IG35_9PLEO|nr:hypothetical protein G6011_03879 [Alternaria panax]